MATESMGPVKCQPWCTDGDGHAGQAFLEDQGCWGRDHVVVCTLDEPGIESVGTFSSELQVNLRQQQAVGHSIAGCREFERGEPYVYLTIGQPRHDIDAAVVLTIDEAVQLRDALDAALNERGAGTD